MPGTKTAKNKYRVPALRELCEQLVRFAPREKKIEQLERAEALIGTLRPDREYSYTYICTQVTRFKPEAYSDLRISGEDARHDLRLMVDELSDAADLRVEEVEQKVYTVEELADRFQVSTKTISRWRELGLVGRRLVFKGRKRVGFTAQAVERFAQENAARVERGASFSQLTEQERDEIIEVARRMAKAGGCPPEVTRRLAQRTGRSVETIRYTLRHFDKRNPEDAIFPDTGGVLTEEIKQRIYQQYKHGESPEVLAKRFCRTRSSIHRIINEVRAKRIMELPLDYIPNEMFEKVTPAQEREILGPMPEGPAAPRKPRLPSGLPPYLASLYEVPLLTKEQEVHLFRKMNYLKYKASKLREQLDPKRPKRRLMDRIEQLYEQAVAVKNEIVSANLRLVVSIAKRHVGPMESFFELVSDGNMSLIRAVEKFDYARGNKFSTYASWAIMKNFARTIPDAHRYRERFRTVDSELFAGAEDERTDQLEIETAYARRQAQIRKILGHLDEREQKIIVRRFGLDREQEPLTLKEVGAELGVTKERIRQIEARALNKLRKLLQEEKIEALELD
ncbi:sigma-70 family RNA polymerase sigma factor [Thermostilla marina]